MGELPAVANTNPESSTLAGSFAPTAADIGVFGAYRLRCPALFPKPADAPADHVAYNPSAIWTVREQSGTTYDLLYGRVEPDRADAASSHLGKSVVRPYIVNPRQPAQAPIPYDKAQEFIGEDAALTRINRRLPLSRNLESIWLLSYVDPRPKPEAPNEVATYRTRFWAGPDLTKLEHVADGPEWMKDIRLAPAAGPLGTELEVYGRPQTQPDSGNITHQTINDIDQLTADMIADAPYIDERLLPIGSGVWGGVNDVVQVCPGNYVLAAHRAWRSGANGHGRHYEAVLYGHDTVRKRIVELGVIATAGMFADGTVKDDASVDLSDVVFTGGGYNGRLELMTFGVRDGMIGIGGLRRVRRDYPVPSDSSR